MEIFHLRHVVFLKITFDYFLCRLLIAPDGRRSHRAVPYVFNIEEKYYDIFAMKRLYLMRYLNCNNIAHPGDLISFIKQNKQDFFKTNENFNRIQLKTKILLEKVTSDGEVEIQERYVGTKFMPIFENACIDSLLRDFANRVDQIMTEGSGFTIVDVADACLHFLNSSRVIKSYGSYVKWPKNAPGIRFIINPETDTDCLSLSIVAVLHAQQNKHPNKSYQVGNVTFYKNINKNGEYFKLPNLDCDDIITHEDLNKIEKLNDINLFIHQLKRVGEDKNNFELILIRKGQNPSVADERNVHLCAIEDSNHLVGIFDIQKFLHRLSKTMGKKHLIP